MKSCDECGGKHHAKGKCKIHYKMPSQLNPKPIQSKSNKAVQSTKVLKPISKLSTKQSRLNKAYSVLRKEYIKYNGTCIFIVGNNICGRPMTDVHHKAGRGKNLLDTTTWMPCCREHHDWIENNRKEATRLGYILTRLGI